MARDNVIFDTEKWIEIVPHSSNSKIEDIDLMEVYYT
jgi:hypothetical protein